MDYLERLRTEHMKSGNCQLCGRFSSPAEFHHEKYIPERGLLLCHKCHHRAHFLPWQLSEWEKSILLRARHGPEKWARIENNKEALTSFLGGYVAPGRRQTQLTVRDIVKGGPPGGKKN